MRSKLWIVGLAVAVAVVFSGSAFAQDEHKHPEKPDAPKKLDCGHDFSKFREALKPTEEQKAKLDELRKKIDAETVGNNRCAVGHLLEEMKKCEKDSDKAKEIQAKVEAMKTVIKEAMDRFQQARESILTEEQKKLAGEMKAMHKEHMEKCLGGQRMKGPDGDRPKGPRPPEGEGKPEGKEPHGKPPSQCSEEECSKEGVFHHHEKPGKPGPGHEEEKKS